MLQINDKLRIIKFDERNLCIEQLKIVKSKKHGDNKQWLCVGYYGNLETALQGILNKKLFDCIDEELEIKDVLGKIEQARQEIKNAKITDLEEGK